MRHSWQKSIVQMYVTSPLSSGNGQPLVFCNVRGTEETDLHKSAEDTIANKREAKKVVRLTTMTFTMGRWSLTNSFNAHHGPPWHTLMYSGTCLRQPPVGHS